MMGVSWMLGSPWGRQSRGWGGSSPWSVQGEGIREMVLNSSPIVDADSPQLRVDRKASARGQGARRPAPTSTLHSTYSDQRVGELRGLHECGCKGHWGELLSPSQTGPGGGLHMN